MIAADQGVPGLVILPVTNSAGPDYDAAATNLTAGIKLRLNAVGMFHAPSFPANRLDLLPSVQRAINVDMTLTPEDLTLPITDPATGQKISKAIGTPYFVLGTLNTVTTNPNKSVQVAATISALQHADRCFPVERRCHRERVTVVFKRRPIGCESASLR